MLNYKKKSYSYLIEIKIYGVSYMVLYGVITCVLVIANNETKCENLLNRKYSFLIFINIQLDVICTDVVDFHRLSHK